MPSNSNADNPDLDHSDLDHSDLERPGSNSPNQVQALLSERMTLVIQLTELNARHIKAETQRSGIEIEISSLEANPVSIDSTSTIPSGLNKLKEKYNEQVALQQSIDTERDLVSKKLDTISEQLDSIY